MIATQKPRIHIVVTACHRIIYGNLSVITVTEHDTIPDIEPTARTYIITKNITENI